MVRVKMMSNGQIVLIDNQKVQVFDKFGNCDTTKYDALTPAYTMGMQNLPIISVLSSRNVDNQTEIALFKQDETMEKHIANMSAIDCISKLQMKKGFIRTLQRSGKEHNIRYNQYILVYPMNTDINEKLYGII